MADEWAPLEDTICFASLLTHPAYLRVCFEPARKIAHVSRVTIIMLCQLFILGLHFLKQLE